MHLYLVQHGDALAKDQDPGRSLSEKGRKDVGRLASFLARSRLPVTRVVHSGKLRAQQTALILADALGAGRVVQECAYPLAPNDPVAPLVEALPREVQAGEGLMIVGHLPYMDRLVSILLGAAENRSCVGFETGTVVALTCPGPGAPWQLDWAMKPRLLGR